MTAPMALEAALEAERMHGETLAIRQEMVELELQPMRYEASLAERRYAACDPENRLIAAQLDKSWEQALQRVAECEARIQAVPEPPPDTPEFTDLATDPESAWNAPGTTTRTRQRLQRTLVTDIIADVDKTAREVALVIHWRGGQHSPLRVHIPASGDHGFRTQEQTDNVVRSMAGSWSDTDIAASLNRIEMSTARGCGWNAKRVRRYRWEYGLPSCRNAAGSDEFPTLTEAAGKLRVNPSVNRRVIRQGVLPAKHAAPRALRRIREADLPQ